jgi:hypothetical protein
VLDPAEQDSAWNMVITPPRECDPLEYASALRMIDPLFAPEIPVRRSTIADENLETLHECDPEDYWAIVDCRASTTLSASDNHVGRFCGR